MGLFVAEGGMAPGVFIDPAESIEESDNPAVELGIPTKSGYRAETEMPQFVGQNRIFDRIFQAISSTRIPHEDQCSAKYYFDVFNNLRVFNGEFSKVVEVGVFMGGSSCLLAGCSEDFNFDLDLVDIDRRFLEFSYERIRRTFPKTAKRVRLFHGDLPTYVRKVMLEEEPASCIVHHDGSHHFDQVVRDLAALYFVKDQIHAVIAQDTHLRGKIEYMNFVDLAIHAIFGTDLNYIPIGTAYTEFDTRTSPNNYQGNYFLPNIFEGLVIPMSVNSFRYPHPKLSIDDFLPKEI